MTAVTSVVSSAASSSAQPASAAPPAISIGEERRRTARVTSGVQAEFERPNPAAATPASAAP